jgi:hypothetical protein
MGPPWVDVSGAAWTAASTRRPRLRAGCQRVAHAWRSFRLGGVVESCGTSKNVPLTGLFHPLPPLSSRGPSTNIEITDCQLGQLITGQLGIGGGVRHHRMPPRSGRETSARIDCAPKHPYPVGAVAAPRGGVAHVQRTGLGYLHRNPSMENA